MAAKAIVIFGATGVVGSALVDLLATQPASFGMGISGLKIVAAAPDAVSALKDKYASAAAGTGNGGGGAGAGAASGGGTAGSNAPKVEVVPIDCDANDMAAVQHALDAAQDRGHSILAVANTMAGGSSFTMKPLAEMTGDEIAAGVTKDLIPAANVLKAAAHTLCGGQHPEPPAAAGGHRFRASIVAVTGNIVHRGMKHHEAFAARKGAVEAMHLSAASTLAQSGVKVNVVAPGLIRAPSSASQSLQEPAASKSAQLYPPHRLVEPEEVAAAIATALAPSLLPFTTGAVIPCDGGLSRVQAYEHPTVHV